MAASIATTGFGIPGRSALAVRGKHGLNPRPRMYLLKKVFQLREKAHPDHEKPFLEHLEDLRVMITRVVITLIIAMIVCFNFKDHLMEVLRRPVEQVLAAKLAGSLPEDKKDAPRPVTPEQWEKARTIEKAASALPEEQRAPFFASLADPDVEFHARSIGILRAARAIPEDARQGFLDGLEVEEDMKRQVTVLLAGKADPDADSRGSLRMMSALKPTETFMLSIKLAFFAGIIISFPLLLMFLLQFVLPGLHNNERRILWPSMAIGFGLFISGVCFAYFVVLPRALGFFYGWSESMGVSNDWRIGEYIGFATQFTLLFGVSFELPVVVMVFVKLGMLTYQTMANTRSYAIVAILIIAAILTPTPDVFTLVLMAMPMIFLYEICIWLAWFDERKARRTEEKEERERMERLLLDRDRYDEPAHHDPAPEDAPEAGDDGWHEEYPQHDPHAPGPEHPLEDEGSPLDPPPDSIPEEEERRRNSYGKPSDES